MIKISPVVSASSAALILILCLQTASASDQLLDIDDNGRIEPLSDGLLIIRYLFGFNGTALTQGALSSDAKRTNASLIEAYLKSQETALDIDLDGQTSPLTDGLLIIRFQFGFTASALTNGAVETNSQRRQALDIAAYLQTLEQPGSAIADSNTSPGSGFGSGSGDGSSHGSNGGQGSSHGSGAGSLLPDLESDLNAHVIALADHIDSHQKPVFYGLGPKVADPILMLALDGQKIDRSNVKALLDADSDEGISLTIMMLLDRVPAAGSGGELAVVFRLIDGNDAERSTGEREIYTRTTLIWSSDGSEIAIEVPVQDQPLTGWDGGGNVVEAEVFDAQPNILTARLTPEYPGYPLMLEIKALELFDERLLNSFLFKDVIPTYFDSVKNYFLVIGLEQTGSTQDFLLSFQGQPFSDIHASLTIEEVIHQTETGFNLTSTDQTAAGLQPGFLAKLVNLGANADEAQGLFTALEGKQLVFNQPPSKFLDRNHLNNELFKTATSVSSPALKLRLDQMPLSEETLEVAITFTDGQDAMRSDSERQLSITFNSQFRINDGQGVLSSESNATTLTLEDGKNCAGSSGCRIDNLTTSSEMFQVIYDSDTESSETLPRLQLSLVPLLGLSGENSSPFTDFFTQGLYHLQVSITGTAEPLTYEGLTVEGLGGVVLIE